MPRFFFDLCDERSAEPDQHGDNFEGSAEAVEQAGAILADMVREHLPIRSGQFYSCNVRNEAGIIVYEASLTFIGKSEALTSAA